MNRMEDALREALRRREPPAGFTERVMAKALEPAVARSRAWGFLHVFSSRRWSWGFAVAAACILMLVGVEHRRAERARAEAARHQVITALRVTSEALESVREQIQKSTSRQVIHLSPGILTVSKERI